jgi:cobalt-zinc-cadmium efflux system membrane fusion protein
MTMTRLTVPLLQIALGVGVGCGGKEETPHAEVATTSATTASPASAPNTVRIDDTMLRDLRITTAKVESRTGSEDVVLLGELAVDERAYAEVGVPVPARAMRLLAAPGDTVREGQALLELQSPELGRARAAHTSAEARLALAERALARKRELAAERIAPLREVQEAEAAVSEAQADVRSAAAELTSLGVEAGSRQESALFVLRSPLAGTVLERSVSRGQMLDPATPAFRIANLSTVWLTAHALERDAVRITKGARVRITFSALPGRDFPGTVALIGGEVSQQSRTIPIRIDVANPSGVLRPGMSASAALPVGESSQQVITVPVAAVQRVRGAWCVFLPKDAGTFEIRIIGRGRDLGSEVEVLSGLAAGETIIVDGAFLLKAQAEKGSGGHGDH